MARLQLSSWALVACLLARLSAAPVPKPVVVNAVPDIYRPIAADQQKLGGMLAARMRANSEGYLEHINQKVVSAATGGNSDHFASAVETGKFLEAAAAAYGYSHDTQLKGLMDRAAVALISQLNPSPTSETSESGTHWREGEWRAVRHVLLGLTSYYAVTGDERATGAAKNVAAMVLSAGKSPSAVALLEPLLALYRYTGESRYLDFLRAVADSWLQSKTEAGNWLQLPALIGVAEMYRVAGVDAYLRAAVNGWKEQKERVSLVGSPAANEASPDSCSNGEVSDWLRLTLSLLRLTGEAQYAEQAEKTIYNFLFAAQNAGDGRLASTVRTEGAKSWSGTNDTCVYSEAHALAAIPDVTWGLYRRGLVVYLYAAGRGTVHLRRRGTIQLYSEATFPESGQVLLHIEPDRPLRFPVRLRVPVWAKQFQADVGDIHLTGKPGELLLLSREWKRGDTVRINFDIGVQAIHDPAAHPDQVALQRGPEVLVLEKTLNPGLEDLDKASLVLGDPPEPKLAAVEPGSSATWSGDQVYSVNGMYNGESKSLLLVPLADAVQYRVWINKAAAPKMTRGSRSTYEQSVAMEQ